MVKAFAYFRAMKTYGKSAYVLLLLVIIVDLSAILLITLGYFKNLSAVVILLLFALTITSISFLLLKESVIIKIGDESISIINFNIFEKNLKFKKDEIDEILIDFEYSMDERFAVNDECIVVKVRDRSYKRRTFFEEDIMEVIYHDLKYNNYNVKFPEYA